MSIGKIWVFNPGHEEALLHAHKANYTASKTVLGMMYELPQLMQYLASEGDYIYYPSKDGCSATLVNHLGETIKRYDTLPALQLSLWALESHTIKRVMSWAKLVGITILSPDISTEYYTLAHRSSSSRFLHYLREHKPSLLPSEEIIPYRLRQESDNIQEVANIIQSQGYPRAMLKRPYSSSGRGVQPIGLPLSTEQSRQIASLIRHYGEVSLEPLLAREQDYALLFYADGSKVQHIGYSKFMTDDRAGTAYSGNLLLPDELIASELTEALGSYTALNELIATTQHYLHAELRGTYEGYIGVDIMTYRDARGKLQLHPCVEINLRCTMGIIAHHLRERLSLPSGCLFRLGLRKQIPLGHQTNRILTDKEPNSTFVAYLQTD